MNTPSDKLSTPTVAFDDLENLSDLEGPAPAPGTTAKKIVSEYGIQKQQYPCGKCRGTGRYSGYTYSGKCYACDGRGYFLTSPEQRAKGRQRTQDKRAAASDSARAFLVARPDVKAWFDRQQAGRTANEFAESLQAALYKYGSLTPNQLAAIERDIAKYEAIKAERAAQAAAPAPIGGLDLRNVPSGHYAVPGGDTRLKVRIDNVAEGKWVGWVFVKDGAGYGHAKKYGSQRPGGVYQGDIRDALTVIASDPRAASAAYGKLVGRCGVCGRGLENEESIALGIGPICLQNNGWSN